MELYNELKNVDIYLIDQILKGRFAKVKTVLDVGFGGGRNLNYFIQNGFEVYGVDSNELSVSQLHAQAIFKKQNFKFGYADDIPFSINFDLIICNAVLHFAEDKSHFERMLFEMYAKLNSKGILFIRLASDIGIEKLVHGQGNGIYRLPDESIRYLVNEKMLLDYTKKLDAVLLEPIKTTNVQNLRCMTTWILQKKER